MLIRGILPNVLNLRGPLLRSPGSGGTTALSTSPSTPEGRSHLISLYKFQGGFKTNHTWGTSHKLSSGMVDNIGWWRNHLLDDFIRLRIIRPPEPLDTELFIDVSTGWGISLILNGKWLAWQLTDGWNSRGWEIGWVEMVAVEFAAQTLITAKFKECHIIVHSDNRGVVNALKAGRSRGSQQNLVLHEIVKLIQDHKLWVSTTWIPSAENPVDNPSRGKFPGKELLYAFPPKLPFHLVGLVYKPMSYYNTRLQWNLYASVWP